MKNPKLIRYRGALYQRYGSVVETLPEVNRERWDDGTEVIFRKSPFPVARKPWVPASALEAAHVTEVPMSTLRASQSSVTQHGTEQYLDKALTKPEDLPIVIYENGLNYIQDGHHRLAATFLRGDDTALVRQVKL